MGAEGPLSLVLLLSDAAAAAAAADADLRWIESDEMIVGIDAWSADGLADKPKTAACCA